MDNLQVTPVQADSTKINSLVVQGEGKPKRNCADWLRDVRMSADVNRTTVGVESERVTPDLMLATSKKLLRVARREEEPDPKDSLEFQRFYGPAEYFAEHIMRDGGKLGRNLLWKATNKGNLDFMQPGALDQHVSDVFYNSMLAQMVDGSSPLELAHATYKTTRIGEGGVGDMESAPDEMRLVQPSFFGYIDPVLSPECYSADTELMTSKGWLSIADVTEDTELACLVDGRLEYHRPEALHKYDGSYSMYCFESSNGISYKVTENHRMYTSCNYALRDGSPCSYLIKTAQEIHGKERRVKTGGHKPLLRNEDCSTFALPEVSPVVKHAQVRGKPPLGANLKNVPEVNVFDFAEYMGWYLAEGNVEIDEESGKYHAVISQSRIEHPDNWNRINELCKRLPFNFGGSSDDHRISIGRKQLAIYLKQFGGSADKFIPQWIFDAPLKARELFRYALLQGDGREQKHLCTMSKRLAEDFARLQFELGESVRILHEPEKRIAGHSGIWVVQWHSRKESTLRGSKRIKGGEKGYFTEEYNGSVYCPTVPGGLVYCRRNGHTGFWCGNSQRVGLDSYITKNCIKGSDGKLYTKFINAHTGKEELVDSVTAAKSIVAAPEMRNAKTKSVFALGGPTGVRIVPRGKIDYYLPNADNAYSMASNMVPMFNGVKEMRLVMGCLHPATNLLVIGRRNEMRIVRASELNGSGEGVYGCGTGGDPAVFRLRNTVAKPPFEARWFRRITLLSGRTITVSRDHRCPLLKGGAMTLEEAGSIRKGDRMLRASFTDIPNRRTFVTGRLVNREMAAFLGLLCRDSHLKGGRISFAMYGRQEKAVGKALKSLGLKPGPVSGGRMELDGGEFTAWYRDEVGSYKAARKVPSCILSSNADICAAFLDAYTTDRNLVGEDACEDIWILDIPNTVVRDGLALLLSRVRIDCAFRDCVHGGSPSYALRLFTMRCDLGSLIADEVKSVEVVRNEPFMIDLDIDDNMYAVANGIVTHNSKYAQQAVSLEHREPPLVRCIDQDTGKDMPTLAGKYLGAQFASKPGRVLAVRQDRVDVQYDDGTKGAIPLYVNFPMNAKGYITSTPQLKAGDHFGKGDCVASSNYTDDKGVSAIGTTMRTGWLSWKGGTYEDGVTLSESAAKKLTSTTMYKTDVDLDRTIKLGKSNYTAWKPSEYSTEQLGVLDDNGVVRPGTVLHKGDPMILAVRTAEPSPGTLGKRILVDMSETWEHDNPGTVTDVVQTRKGVKVFATVTAPAEVGDKVAGAYGNKGVVAQILPDDQMPQDSHGKPLEMLLSPLGLVSRCYDEETEFLTEGGWKYGRDVLDSDRLYCYDPESGKWHWGPQLEPFHRAYYSGRMYGHRNALTDFLVTPGHRVWARKDGDGSFAEHTVNDLYGCGCEIPLVGSAQDFSLRPCGGGKPACIPRRNAPHMPVMCGDGPAPREDADLMQFHRCLDGSPSVMSADGDGFRVSTGPYAGRRTADLGDGWYTVEGYDGMTYCPTVDTGYILTRRNGKVACLGNTNPSQLHEAVLGKIAKKTGEVQRIPQFYDGDLYKYVMDKAKQAHVSPDDDFTDPETGRTVKGVVNGYSYIYKLKHLAESKLSARGTDEYDQDQVPAGKGMTGCFPACQNIMTIHGEQSIATLVEKRKPEHVLTFDGEAWAYRRITDWFTYRAAVDDIVNIKLSHALSTTGTHMMRHHTTVTPTKNHKMYMHDMSIRLAGNIRAGDRLAGIGPVPTEAQRQALLGTLMGDSCSTLDGKVVCEHSLKQIEYLNFKYDLFKGLGATLSTEYSRERSPLLKRHAPYGGRVSSRVITIPQSCFVSDIIGETTVGRTRHLSASVLDGMGDLGLCLWFLDDGCMYNRSKNKGKVNLSGGIATQGFAAEETEEAIEWLKGRFGLEKGVTAVSKALAGGKRSLSIGLSHNACMRMAELMSRNIPYAAIPKTKKWLRAYCETLQEGQPPVAHDVSNRLGIVPVEVISVEPYKHDKPGVSSVPVYDFTVEDTHKYTLAGGILVSNSKRYGGLEQTALVGHNAFDAILDAKLLRGQSNSEFWRSIRTGGIPTIPGEPLVHRKFFAHLTGAGINVRRTPKGISCFTLSKGDVDELAGPRELKSRDTYEAKNFRPIDGGLFGQDIFGMNGDKWAYIRLDEPLPNPVMEEPLARLLRIPVKDFEAVAAGAKEVDGMKSSSDIETRLKGIDLTAEAEKAKRELKDASHSKRDNALKRYVAIENMRRNGVKPADYMLDKIPVLPPIYRPISSHSGLTMVADSNYLYAQLLDMRDDLRDSMSLPEAYRQKARANLYRGWKELAGLYDPEDVKLKNKNVGGLLKWALGDSPKWSAWQRKVVGATVDTVGRGVVTPDPRIRLNELGIPKDMAFGMMAPFVERELVKRGYTPIDAMKAVKQRTKLAGDVLLEVMKTHPVQMNRAPTLHKYNVMAFQPVLAAGHAVHVNPSIVVPFNMDFDGDTANIHVPVSDKARQDLRQRMFPERNLLAVRDRKILYKPEKEYQQGLYIATRMKDAGKAPSRMFNTVDEAREAYRQGLIDIDDPITIRDAN